MSLSVCLSIISTTVHPINFTLGSGRTDVQCQGVWMSGSQESEKHCPAEPESQRSPRPTVLDVCMREFKWQKNYILMSTICCDLAGVLLRTQGSAVASEVVWMSSSRDSCTQQYRRPSNWPVVNRQGRRPPVTCTK